MLLPRNGCNDINVNTHHKSVSVLATTSMTILGSSNDTQHSSYPASHVFSRLIVHKMLKFVGCYLFMYSRRHTMSINKLPHWIDGWTHGWMMVFVYECLSRRQVLVDTPSVYVCICIWISLSCYWICVEKKGRQQIWRFSHFGSPKFQHQPTNNHHKDFCYLFWGGRGVA